MRRACLRSIYRKATISCAVGERRAEGDVNSCSIYSCESAICCQMWWGSNSKEQHELLFPTSLVAVENIVSAVGNGLSLARGAVACWELPSRAGTAGMLSARPREEHVVPSWAFTRHHLQSWDGSLDFCWGVSCVVAWQLLAPWAKSHRTSELEQISTEDLTEATASHLVACWKLPPFLVLCVSYFAKSFDCGGNEIWNQANFAWR